MKRALITGLSALALTACAHNYTTDQTMAEPTDDTVHQVAGDYVVHNGMYNLMDKDHYWTSSAIRTNSDGSTPDAVTVELVRGDFNNDGSLDYRLTVGKVNEECNDFVITKADRKNCYPTMGGLGDGMLPEWQGTDFGPEYGNLEDLRGDAPWDADNQYQNLAWSLAGQEWLKTTGLEHALE